MSDKVPAEPPPSYADATGPSSSRPAAGSSSNRDESHLQVPASSSTGSKASIPSAYRRSMEDEQRSLPSGWVRTHDPESGHHFYVDTTKEPPRSIWAHPYDDDEYLASLTTEDRERIEHESLHRGKRPSHADIIAAHSDVDDEDDEHTHTAPAVASAAASSSTRNSSKFPDELPARGGEGKAADNRSFGRKFKDKITGTSHEQREAERKMRAKQEQRAYEQHVRVRQAMSEAMRTGRPVLVGKDQNGKDVYVEPPAQQPYYGGGGGFGPYGGGGYGYSPYGAGQYMRPSGPYRRPYGGGMGGGYGLPLALGGGLLGGLLLGDALGGGF